MACPKAPDPLFVMHKILYLRSMLFAHNTIHIGVARGCTGCTYTPWAEKKKLGA